jgi:hypothetical protein
LLAALLAVLGKQWLMYYSSAGDSRGTIEERGLERQRKLDGLRKWKFESIMQTFPLLLQLALLIFSAALSTYLWTVHLSLALIVLIMTVVGFTSYMTLLASAVVFTDSPFWNPPTIRDWFSRAPLRSREFICWVYSTWSSYYFPPGHPLPYYSEYKDPDTLFDPKLLRPSPEVPAVAWLLETSTDPQDINAAAAMASDLQCSFLACFDYYHNGYNTYFLTGILDGMTPRSIQLGRALGTLQCVSDSSEADYKVESKFHVQFATSFKHRLESELEDLVTILGDTPHIDRNPSTLLATKWGLHVIPSLRSWHSYTRLMALESIVRQFENKTPRLGCASFTDYLFCIIHFLSPISKQDIVWMDKR